MIDGMNVVALVAGILVGMWCFSRQTMSWILIVLHSSAFSTEKGFYSLYDASDDELSFKWYREHNIRVKKYADYLKLHADARATAYVAFKATYVSLKKHLAFRIAPLALAPAILFWSNWLFYLSGVFAALIAFAVFELSRNGMRPGFYQRLVVYTALNAYAKTAR